MERSWPGALESAMKESSRRARICWDHRGQPRRYIAPRGDLRDLGGQAPTLRLRAASGLCGDAGTPGRAAVPGMIEPRAADVLGLLLSGDGRRRAGVAAVGHRRDCLLALSRGPARVGPFLQYLGVGSGCSSLQRDSSAMTPLVLGHFRLPFFFSRTPAPPPFSRLTRRLAHAEIGADR